MSADMTGLATKSQRPNLHYDLSDPSTGVIYQCPPTGWRYEPKRMNELIANNEVIFPAEPTGRPRRKKFMKDLESEYTGLSSILETVYSTQGTRELRELYDGKEYFDFPKPVDYIKLILSQGIAPNERDSIYVLDFFGGSSSTAQAAMQLISEGNVLNYILVQIQAPFEKETEAFKAGFNTIDEFGFDRIKRAAKKIKTENPLFHGDLGFRHFTLKEPSGKSLEKIVKFDKNATFGDYTIMDEFGVPTILTTWLERDGYGLTADYRVLDLNGYEAYYIDKHLYLINPDLSDEAVAMLLDKYQTEAAFNPQNIVIFGYSFDWSELQSLKDSLQTVHAGEKNLRINFETRY